MSKDTAGEGAPDSYPEYGRLGAVGDELDYSPQTSYSPDSVESEPPRASDDPALPDCLGNEI